MESDDAALARVVAAEGVGITAVPTIVAADAVERYGFEILGRTEECRAQLFLITADRRIEHPVLVTLAKHAREALSRRHGTRKKPVPA